MGRAEQITVEIANSVGELLSNQTNKETLLVNLQDIVRSILIRHIPSPSANQIMSRFEDYHKNAKISRTSVDIKKYHKIMELMISKQAHPSRSDIYFNAHFYITNTISYLCTNNWVDDSTLVGHIRVGLNDLIDVCINNEFTDILQELYDFSR